MLGRRESSTYFLLYIEKEKFLRSGMQNRLSSQKEEKNFCSWAQRILQWMYLTQKRNRFFSLYKGENFLCSGTENPPVDLPRPGAEPTFFSKRGEKFLLLGPENPPVDLPRPGAEHIFFSIQRRKFSVLGLGESSSGSTAPGHGTYFLLYIEKEKFLHLGTKNPPVDLLCLGVEPTFFSIKRKKNFCARARTILQWIYHAQVQNRLSSQKEERNFCSWAQRILQWIYRARERNRFSSLYRREMLRNQLIYLPLAINREFTC